MLHQSVAHVMRGQPVRGASCVPVTVTVTQPQVIDDVYALPHAVVCLTLRCAQA